ncbi:hypothetical protein Dsin_023874 [Dipteronia sinensis]|uniref:C2 domain-containing protein n=1 Tax=Dipteronia sinensis TaxID=43782 RepID=A0AAE0A5P0_9ROSI|nr:hypothetical protein Dsin_023874 [Dipteronia sinensis]
MGMCFSGDVRGGKQAVGGAQGRPTEAHNNNNASGHNDAVDFFFRSRGLQALFTRIELRDRDIISKSDPMAVVYAKKREGTLEEIGRTEVIMNSLNPAWIVKVSIAYQFEIVQPLVFHVYDVDTKYHNVSVKTIMEVGEVIQFYDSDRRFPTWGFGGNPFNDAVSHCFNLNGMPNGSEVEGVDGIMAAYASALHNVALAGPTLFGPVINMATEIAGQSLSHDDRSKYFVLLIITDGVLTDLQETKDALVRASDLPLSILIVGVGGADFTQMEILDADNGGRLESSTGRVATRDIVQFVPMQEVHSGRISGVQALLEELPGQFLSCVRARDIKPHNLQVAETSSTLQNYTKY